MSEHSPTPVSTRGVYGFVLYIASYTLLFFYLIWAYVPTAWFHLIGLTFWPQKLWAVTISVFVCYIIAIFLFLIYPGIVLRMTPDLSSIHTVVDEYTTSPIASVKGCIPPIYDMHVTDVSRKLFLKGKQY